MLLGNSVEEEREEPSESGILSKTPKFGSKFNFSEGGTMANIVTTTRSSNDMIEEVFEEYNSNNDDGLKRAEASGYDPLARLEPV